MFTRLTVALRLFLPELAASSFPLVGTTCGRIRHNWWQNEMSEYNLKIGEENVSKRKGRRLRAMKGRHTQI